MSIKKPFSLLKRKNQGEKRRQQQQQQEEEEEEHVHWGQLKNECLTMKAVDFFEKTNNLRSVDAPNIDGPAIRGPGREAKHNEDVPQLQGGQVFFPVLDRYKMGNEKRAPGWLGYIGDEILPCYI